MSNKSNFATKLLEAGLAQVHYQKQVPKDLKNLEQAEAKAKA
jgi:endonuclease YncB( thermonuclease family)